MKNFFQIVLSFRTRRKSEVIDCTNEDEMAEKISDVMHGEDIEVNGKNVKISTIKNIHVYREEYEDK